MKLRIHNTKKFGLHVRALREAAGMSVRDLAAKTNLHIRIIEALERGIGGQALHDDLVDSLMDNLPRFSPATSPGLHDKPVKLRDQR